MSLVLWTGKELVVTVWTHTFPIWGRRLGIVYCMNRPCSLYRIPAPSADSKVRLLSGSDMPPSHAQAQHIRATSSYCMLV